MKARKFQKTTTIILLMSPDYKEIAEFQVD